MTPRSGLHLTWSFLGLMIAAIPAWAETWSLTNQERRLYLGYYAPVIFKKADESADKHHGYDWITNFDFDRDGVYSNNKANWEDVDRFVSSSRLPGKEAGRRDRWQIRPTLYTAIIEFMQGGRKSVVLLYHIYHAKQQYSIHDWERVEIRVDGVGGLPGEGAERIAYAVITTHGKHDRRGPGDAGWNFWQTGFGKHLMVWQAPWSSQLWDFYRGELRWIEQGQQAIAEQSRGRGRAALPISGARRPRDVNYVFVCDCAPEARADWRARRINRGNAAETAAKSTGRAGWHEVPRITYELQDLADILPSHWIGNPYQLHWTPPGPVIELESPILSEDGTSLVPAGRQQFYTASYDAEDAHERRGGYLKKHWFWGTYLLGRNGSFRREAFRKGAPKAGRGMASGRPEAHGGYWWQHDYFAHDGAKGDGTIDGERGAWLPGAWYSPAKGGFDGRWVQLFADNPLELEARVPAAVDRVTPRPAELLDLANTAASSISR